MDTNWTVVLENQSYIKKIARNLAKNTNLDVEDFTQQVYINIATHYYLFNPMKGTFNTFIYWRVMATRKACLYNKAKHKHTYQLKEEMSSNALKEMEIKIEYNDIYRKLSFLEKEAFDTYIEGISRKDLPMNYHARNARIYRLRDKLCQTVRK